MRTASVTTMEPRFAISPYIGEFFCFITSPAYAAPCTLWWTHHTGMMPAAVHLALVSCCLTAVFSTLYHATLTKITSSLDAGQAVVTFWLVSLLLCGVTSLAIHAAAVAVLAAIYARSWRKTATISIILTSFVVPPAMYVLTTTGEAMAALVKAKAPIFPGCHIPHYCMSLTVLWVIAAAL